MAQRQPLKGPLTQNNAGKVYDVLMNFNKGIDKKTADDVSLDSSFKNLKNFYNQAEGYLSKRPGVYNTNISDLMKELAKYNFTVPVFNIVTNKFNETAQDLIPRLQDLYSTIFLSEEKMGAQFKFKLDKIIGFQVLKNSFFLEFIQHYEDILEGNHPENIGSDTIEFSCIIVGGGYYKALNETSLGRHGLYISRINVVFTYDETNSRYDVNLEIDNVDATMNPYEKDGNYLCRWQYLPDNYVEGDTDGQPALPIDVSNYNGFSYIATGTNYIVKIAQNPDVKTADANHPGESNIIQQIGGYEQENLYRPTAIELNQIGFNVLSHDPLTYVDRTGSTSKTKGVFYSIDVTKDGETFKQPVTKVPYNSEFYMHIIYTGNTAPSEIKYRPDNGETDTEKNPYKNFPGAWYDNDHTIWKCTGIDSDQKFEIYIKLGNDEFRTFITTTSNPVDETGYINEISKLVYSSTRSKIINNQLVLYGGHGYLFFSEYDNFSYYPNYYYVYIASEAGEEEVTNISYFRQYYAIFTNKRIKRMTGSFGTEEFGIYPLSDYIGCPNGRTVKSIGNNLLFLGNDGIYKLKQGYLGEGTENIEKIDEILGGDLNLNNVVQAFVMNNNYIVIKNDGTSWIVFNSLTEAFYEYNLESKVGRVYKGKELDKEMAAKTLPFYSAFQSNLYDSNGDFLIVPMYNYTYNLDYTNYSISSIDFMLFRFHDLDFLNEENRHKDGEAFISMLETHSMNMGYPTHTKKFKDVFIKIFNETGRVIPLYVTIKVDDTTVIDPSDYYVYYNEENDTYYYLEKIESNAEIDIGKALGEFTIGVDPLGDRTIQQIRFRVRYKGRSIKIILSDGYNDYTTITTSEGQRGIPIRQRNLHDFSISSIGIVYKLKKVREG